MQHTNVEQSADPESQRSSSDDSAHVLPGKPRLFAVIVGINRYEGLEGDSGMINFPPLKGCVDDAFKIKMYLDQLKDFEVHAQILLNEHATKRGLVNAISTHLTKAKIGDVAFLYFSGHGAQEHADKVWRAEHDEKLECLVCAPDPGMQGGYLLADKELRYLINRIHQGGPHIVVVSDCCHSGENTRGAGFEALETVLPIEKKIPYVFAQRQWNDFVFSHEISRDDVMDKGENEAIPEGVHIQLSACESNQSAVEVAGEGVFTKALLEVLNSVQGNITYYSLRSRLRQYLRVIYEQVPKIYVAGGGESGLYTNFLNRKTGGKSKFAEVVFNRNSGWLLNLGAIHGLTGNISSLQLLDIESKEMICKAKATSLKTDYTLISPESEIDKTKVYLVYVEELLSKKIKLFLDDADLIVAGKEIMMQIARDPVSSFILEDDEEASDYVVRAPEKFIYITKPNEKYRPVCSQVLLNQADAKELILNQLLQIGKWEFIKNLSNELTSPAISSDSVDILIHQLQQGKYAVPGSSKDEQLLLYELVDKKWQTALSITITNKLNVPVYGCIPYLSTWFGSNLDLVNPAVFKLEPGVPLSLPLAGGNLVKRLPDAVRLYNWPQHIEYLKILFSTDEFDGSSFALDEIPPPGTGEPPDYNRGVSGIRTMTDKPGLSWVTKLVTLRFMNPLYNKIEGEELAALLQNPVTAEFALNIYFDCIDTIEKGNYGDPLTDEDLVDQWNKGAVVEADGNSDSISTGNTVSTTNMSASNSMSASHEMSTTNSRSESNNMSTTNNRSESNNMSTTNSMSTGNTFYRLKPNIELIKGEPWKIGISESQLVSMANSLFDRSKKEPFESWRSG